MYVVITQTKGSPAKAHLGPTVEFDPVNGGWIVLRQNNGDSSSFPVDIVHAVYEVVSE